MKNNFEVYLDKLKADVDNNTYTEAGSGFKIAVTTIHAMYYKYRNTEIKGFCNSDEFNNYLKSINGENISTTIRNKH